MRQKLWLVSEVFYPDTDIATGNIVTEIAIKFIDQFDVHVICGPAGYEKKSIELSKNVTIEDKITIHRIESFNFNKNKSILRLLRVVGISGLMFFKGFMIGKRDKVFVVSNPAFITLLFGWLRRLKGFEYVLLMHDVFPENLIPAGYINGKNLLYQFLHSLFVRSRRSANKIIVLGRDMKDLISRGFLLKKAPDIKIIPNWADTDNIYPTSFRENPIIRNLNIANKIVILFAGNHGILQNLFPFFKIIEQVKNEELHFIFAGGGATKQPLISYAQERELKNVSFFPAFPQSELLQYQNACTIGLVSLSDELYGVGVPSKSYNICAAGKPILFLGNTNTEIAQFVKENEIGWAFDYNDELLILDFLNNLNKSEIEIYKRKGLKGREIVEAKYNKKYILEKLLNVICD